jgi:predicted transcriptional regulator
MGIAFWIRRFLLVFAGALVIISGARLAKGNTLEYALTDGLLWAAITAAAFTAVRIYKSRKGQHCAICADTPPSSVDTEGKP